MRTELITKDELMTHLREEGVSSIAEVEQACMEPDGMISVIKKTPASAPVNQQNVEVAAGLGHPVRGLAR
jgi:uncharacterized membrane protein YcaP (DUF421 family)